MKKKRLKKKKKVLNVQRKRSLSKISDLLHNNLNTLRRDKPVYVSVNKKSIPTRIFSEKRREKLNAIHKKNQMQYKTNKSFRFSEMDSTRRLHAYLACRKRVEKRAMLFKMRIAGKGKGGSHKPKTYTEESFLDCDRILDRR